jgi:hypothetical protein
MPSTSQPRDKRPSYAEDYRSSNQATVPKIKITECPISDETPVQPGEIYKTYRPNSEAAKDSSQEQVASLDVEYYNGPEGYRPKARSPGSVEQVPHVMQTSASVAGRDGSNAGSDDEKEVVETGFVKRQRVIYRDEGENRT